MEVEGLPDRTGGLSLRPAGNFEVERVFREESGKACAASSPAGWIITTRRSSRTRRALQLTANPTEQAFLTEKVRRMQAARNTR